MTIVYRIISTFSDGPGYIWDFWYLRAIIPLHTLGVCTIFPTLYSLDAMYYKMDPVIRRIFMWIYPLGDRFKCELYVLIARVFLA